MIERIVWPETGGREEFISPFQRGTRERPLRITFHTQSLRKLSESDEGAVDVLRELSRLSEIDAMDTEPDHQSYLTVRPASPESEFIPFIVQHADGSRTEAGIPSPHGPAVWRRMAEELAEGQHWEGGDVVERLHLALLLTLAHDSAHRDIFVTTAPGLLLNKGNDFVHRANCRTPLEALKLTGLYLRASGNYTYAADAQSAQATNPGLFYWVLARHRLPGMWRYFSACKIASEFLEDDTLQLCQSVLTRAIRALEARDFIGEQFYLPQNNDTRNRIMYHFDYLTLVLAGAFDAQARVARRVYRIQKPGERQAGFRHKDFLKALQTHGADHLADLVQDQHNADILTLLHELRNTIHGASLPTLSYGDAGGSRPQESYIEVPSSYASAVCDASTRCGGAERWGVIQGTRLRIEPFTFATTVVEEGLLLINEIAGATDIIRLLTTQEDLELILLSGPPSESPFDEWTRHRFDLLG